MKGIISRAISKFLVMNSLTLGSIVVGSTPDKFVNALAAKAAIEDLLLVMGKNDDELDAVAVCVDEDDDGVVDADASGCDELL
jgi:hypothetical protein